MKNLIIVAITVFLNSCAIHSTYYVDSNTGSDNNSGKSPRKAWASLEKVNQTEFKPGDMILFKSGSSWNGQLELKGSGSAEAPIQINKYGEGKNPAIHGKGEKLHTLLLHNVEYWEINNLEITNKGTDRAAGRRGIIISAKDFGDCHHICLDSLEVHDINGSLVKKEGGGSAIYWKNRGDSIKTRFVGLVIENCYLHHCERNGINSTGNISRKNWFPSTGVVIRNNILEQIPGDGIVPIGCEGALIENNIMRDCPDILSHEEAAAGIWPWSSDHTIIQYNEVSGHRAKWDGQGFDSDYNCIGTIIQYNYSHDNYGGFLLICNNGETYGTDGNIGTDSTIIRFNVSVNDGIRPYPTKREGWFSPVMHITGPVKNSQIYNNLIIVPEKESENIAKALIQMDNWGGSWPENSWFANNIFIVEGKSEFIWGNVSRTFFTNNCYFGNIKNLPSDQAAFFVDPELVNPNAKGNGFEVVKNFRLKDSSPLIGKGIQLKNEALKDIFGRLNSGQNSVNLGIGY